jgi:hypothetical protein
MKSPLNKAETYTNEQELASFVLHAATFEQRQAIRQGEIAKNELLAKQQEAQAAVNAITRSK